MYSLSEVRTPLVLNYSKSPIICSWVVQPYSPNETQLNTMLTVKVEIWYNNGELSSKVFKLRPDQNGKAQLDLQSLIDTYLEFEIPNVLSQTLQISSRQVCRFSVSAILINDYEQLALIEKKWYYAIKGGLPKEQNRQADFFIHNIASQKQFLRYPISGETKFADEVFVLSALCYLPDNTDLIASPKTAEALYRYRAFSDSNFEAWTSIAIEEDFVSFGETVHLPFCIKDKVPNYASFDGIEIEVLLKLNNIETLIGKQKIYIASTHESSETGIYWHNSLGGVDNLVAYHVDEKQWSYERSKVALIDIAEFKSKNVIQHNFETYAISERASPKIKTKPLSQEELERLRPIFLNGKAYILRNSLLIPTAADDSNMSISDTDGLYSLAINWIESISNINYMPENGVISTGVCPVPLLFKATCTEANILNILFAFAPNQYEGTIQVTNIYEPQLQPIVSYVKQNEGNIKMDVSTLNPSNSSIYSLAVGLRTNCGVNSESQELSTLVEVYRFSPPTLPTLFATTYQGAGYRVLTFQSGNQNLLALTSSNNNANFVILVSAEDPGNSLSGLSNAQGAFNISTSSLIMGANGQQLYAVNYSPLNSFNGNDVITYWAWAQNGNNAAQQSARQEGKIYVKVEGAQTVTSNNSVTTIYVRWDVDESGATYEAPRFEGSYYKYYWKKSYLRYFSDPHGNNPLDLTGMGIFIRIERSFSGSGGNGTAGESVPASGIENEVKYLIKYTYKKKKESTYENWIEEDPDYYVIE